MVPDAEQSTRPFWKGAWANTILAGLANYIDGGSIVAGAAALKLWADSYHLTDRFLGLVAALSANAIAGGVGALAGGYLCDRFGRKKIYQYDMVFYGIGMAWLTVAWRPWMILVGTILVGLAVGADIPASWTLIAENAPEGRRGAHSGVAQVFWLVGPLVVSLMFVLLAPLGLFGARLAFGHLCIIALMLSLLRRRMFESVLWESVRDGVRASVVAQTGRAHDLKKLLSPLYLKRLAFLCSMYGIWNLCAGTLGFFLPYILRTVGGESQATAVGLQGAAALVSIASLLLIFMRLVDKVNQRLLLGLSVATQIVGTATLVMFPITLLSVCIFLFVSALAAFGSPQAFYQLWSAELFPTLFRGTAQGLTFAIVRIMLGVWSVFVPALLTARFSTLVWVLIAFLAVSGLIGVVGAPRNGGKSLWELEVGE